MIEQHARTLAALDRGALTASELSARMGVSRSQVGEYLRALASIGFVRGNSCRPRLWAMTGEAKAWSRTSTGRSAMEFKA